MINNTDQQFITGFQLSKEQFNYLTNKGDFF
jgi:hypothetical protein